MLSEEPDSGVVECLDSQAEVVIVSIDPGPVQQLLLAVSGDGSGAAAIARARNDGILQGHHDRQLAVPLAWINLIQSSAGAETTASKPATAPDAGGQSPPRSPS